MAKSVLWSIPRKGISPEDKDSTLEEAIEMAKARHKELLEEGYPEDDWEAVANNWDVNYWMEGVIPRVTIYPVANGNIDVLHHERII